MQKTWFCVHSYLGNVVLMGVFVFPDPDPDLSGGGGGRGPVRLRSPAPGPALGPNSSRPARRAVLDPRRALLPSLRRRRNSVQHGTPRRRTCRRAPTVHVRVDSSL